MQPIEQILDQLPGRPEAGVPGLVDLCWWERQGSGWVGAGGPTVTVTGPDRLAHLSRLWRRITERFPTAGDAPRLAFVSSVFDGSSPTATVLRLPRWVQRLEDGAVVSSAQERPGQAVDPGALRVLLADEPTAEVVDGWAPDTPRGTTLTPEGYVAAVEAALETLRGGELHKIVLAREEFREASADRQQAALQRLRERFPQCWVFAVGGLFGATPEMLVAKSGARFRSLVLAGSLPRGRADDEGLRARLAVSEVFAVEHRAAADSVIRGLAGVGRLDDERPEPFILELPNIFHLATAVEGEAADPGRDVVGLVDAIHPTAAVAGVPTGPSLDRITELEPRDRGRYAGPVGWIDSNGDGELGLALRCGLIEGDGVRIYAGCGIVAGADPAQELAETVGKLRPMSEALA